MYSNDLGFLQEFGTSMILVSLVFLVVIIASYWKIFTKAGRPGWASIVPIYNLVVLFQIVGLSPWLILVYLAVIIPFFGYLIVVILNIYLYLKLAKAFGHGIGMGILMFILPIIFVPILAFGDSRYQLQTKTSLLHHSSKTSWLHHS